MKERNFGLDLTRCIAIFFVISVHFFLNIGFNSHKVIGEGMFISLFLRWTFYCSVPLFLLLTGYLKRKKQINKNHYKSIIPIIISYIFISIICILFRKFYLHQDITLLKSLITIGNFTADGYAWYIEMYIGLFLLIPFLNILYDNLKTKQNKKHLIMTLIIIIGFSPLINKISLGGGLNLEIVPNYWDIIYPILYYFIGSYISEYQPKIKKSKLLFIFLSLILLETIITYIYSYNYNFNGAFFNGYNSILTVTISTTLFLLVYDIKCSKKPLQKIAQSISTLSLDMYLFSWIVDQIIYPFIKNYIHEPLDYLKFYLITVLTIFITTYLLSLIKKYFFKLLNYLKNKLLKSKKCLIKRFDLT